MRYYSESKPFNWLRAQLKIQKPWALEIGEWEKWEQHFRLTRPVAFWLTETLPDWLEKPAEWFVDPVYRVKCYISNRWITKTHSLTSDLKPGQWHELDTRILHSLFNELVNFVEIEKAHMAAFCGDPQILKYRMPWWNRTKWFRWKQWRSAQAGTDYLKWESQLTHDESSGHTSADAAYGKPTSQAVAAQQTLELYHWWTYQRPARPDPLEISGWNAFYEQKHNDSNFSWQNITAKESRMFKRINQIEKRYAREDQKMLIKLIRLCPNLWT
jgi:hypothetical protein